MSEQEQFLDVIDRDEAERRFHAAIGLSPCGDELVPIREALGRVLARDVVAAVDVPSFDRSNYDGYAVRAADTYGAAEETPRRLRLLDEPVVTGGMPRVEVAPGTAVAIATGGMLPRGADAVVMVEHAEAAAGMRDLLVRRAIAAGHGVSFAGTDIAAGETVLFAGTVLTSRETGVLAAIGARDVLVFRRPRVAILSTGDEIIPPGEPMQPGKVYDSNARILADAVRESGGEPVSLGTVSDDAALLRARLGAALQDADVVLLSGGTSKGQGDLCYRVVAELTEPGIVAHGVALKPGKPICLASHGGRPVVILPGFPTSAVFTFHEFVAPVLRKLAGRPDDARATARAKLAVKVNSEIGRTEYLLVGLIEKPVTDRTTQSQIPNSKSQIPWLAFPMGKGSGSVTAFSRADGFIAIDRYTEIVPAGTHVDVTLLGRDLQPADLVVIGSHCIGLDYLLGEMQRRGWRTKLLAVGSTAGLEAARRGECDFAGIHLLDLATGEYNRPFVDERLELVRGYGRRQGIVYRAGDRRFEGRSPQEAISAVRNDPQCVMINRNRGSGTRILIDRLLSDAPGDGEPRGYSVQARNHNAVAAAIRQGRADWGVAIEGVVQRGANERDAALGFQFLLDEQYDFAVSSARSQRPAVLAFLRLLEELAIREHLRRLGFILAER
jgi:putative molybdopterin biosynthesis protein